MDDMQRSSIGNGEELLSDFCGNLTGVLLLTNTILSKHRKTLTTIIE
jgi:hypothetical protein